MALSDPYATAAEYRAVVKPDADSSGDSQLTTDLKAISRYLDGKLGQFFGKDAADVSRTFDYWPRRCSKLYRYPVIDRRSTEPPLPPIVSVTSVTFADGTVLHTGDLDLYPLDATFQPEQKPYRAIGRANNTGFPYGGLTNRITIVMKAGWPAVPEAIKATTIQICAILRLETPRATRRIPEMGEAIETSPSAQVLVWRLMDSYKLDWLY